MTNAFSKFLNPHKYQQVMEQVTDKLTDLVGEKYIAEEILNMKYAMEHKEKMDGICNSFTNMTCVVLNTVNKEDNVPTQTHLIFHEKMDADIIMTDAIEHYVFAFQFDELHQLSYINNIIQKKGELFLNTEEYNGLYDATLMQ